MNTPLVSIITPCYNMAHCIGRLFDSVLAQDYSPLEYIVVNDGSTDSIEQVISVYRPKFAEKGIRFVFYTQQNQGLSGAICAGLQQISGKYFIWPDADDYLEPQSISARVALLEAHPEAAVVTGQAYLRDSDRLDTYKRILRESNQTADKKVQFERMLNGDALFCAGCHMVRTEMFFAVNPDRKIYEARRGQNWQMLLPLYYAYPRLFLDQPVYNYLDFPNSMSGGDDTLEKQLLRYEEHESILIATLEKIEATQNADLSNYRRFIIDKYAKARMEAAIDYNDASLFVDVYQRKKMGVGVDFLDYIAKMRNDCAALRKPLTFLYKVVRKCRG